MSSVRAEIAPSKPRRPRSLNPRDSWPASTDERWTIIEPSEPRPTFEPPQPPASAQAWHSGFNRGYEQDAAAIPSADLAKDLVRDWWLGHSEGWVARDCDDLLIDNHQADASDHFEHSDRDVYPLGGTT